MNDMRRTIAAVGLFTALCAIGYLMYQLVVVRPTYEADMLQYMSCTARREAALKDWQYFQDHFEQLYWETHGKVGEFAGLEKLLATKVKCPDYDDLTPPIYGLPGSIAIVGLIASLVLFGAVKPKQN
jgi:hypothetical protein